MIELLNRLKDKDRRGSKVRCHLLTHGDDAVVAERLTTMISPFGQVRPDHRWLPRGFECTTEARLGETPELLADEFGRRMKEWWLKFPEGANTPNWDIAGTCEIQGRRGLLLVEAKAHRNELSCEGKPMPGTPNGTCNHARIAAAIREASAALNNILGEWGLSRDHHYQLSNRFAWAWKLASLGAPVVLVYLGFLNADEMGDRGQPFRSPDDWDKAVRAHGEGVVPERVWNGSALDVDGTPLRALIRSWQVALPA